MDNIAQNLNEACSKPSVSGAGRRVSDVVISTKDLTKSLTYHTQRRVSDSGNLSSSSNENPKIVDPNFRPKPLPRKIKNIDLEAIPLPPVRTYSLGFENPLYSEVPNANERPPLTSLSGTKGNSYEEVIGEFKQIDDASNIDQNVYGTVTHPISLIHNSNELLTNITFQSPIENNDFNLNAVSSQSSPPSFPTWEDFDLDPPAFPPPVLQSSEFEFEIFADSNFPEAVPTIPPRPQSSISSSSDGSDHLNFEIKPKLPAKKSIDSATSLITILPPPPVPTRLAPVPPERSSIKPKRHPPKPPRKSKPVSTKILPQSIFPYKDYLYLAGSNFSKQEFLWRWCILDQDLLEFYDDPDSLTSTGRIKIQDIISLSMARIKKQDNLPELFCFTLHSLKDGGKQYVIGTTFLSSRHLWMTKLICALAPKSLIDFTTKLATSDWHKVREFCRAGYLYMKEGISGSWHKVFFVLQHNLRMIHAASQEKFDIDLRKIINLKLKQIEDESMACKDALEVGYVFHIDLPGRTLYFQSNLKIDTMAWFQALTRCLALGNGNIIRSVQLTQDNVPVIVDKLVKFVSTHGGTVEGIYRHAGQDSKVKNLLEIFKPNAWMVHLKSDEVTPQEASNALKRFLRNLNECLLTDELCDLWIANSSVMAQKEKLNTYKNLLNQLPRVNYATLKFLIGHLVSIVSLSSQNKMTSSNVASIFGPTLLYKSESPVELDADFTIMNAKMDVIKDFINFYPTLFEIDNKELEKEQKINEALEKLKQAQLEQKPAGHILVGVYIYTPLGKCVNVRIPPTMKALNVIKCALEHANISDKLENLILYEVIGGGDLERIVHNQELVLPVVLQWSSYAPDFSKDNYLVIKENSLLRLLKSQLQVPSSLFCELKYADSISKAFKKAVFEFSRARLSYYKTARESSALGIWNIEDIIWYLGAEAKRNAPSKWTFTFIVKKDSCKRSKDQYFGTTVCCHSEDEYHKWLSAMIVAEHPGIFNEI